MVFQMFGNLFTHQENRKDSSLRLNNRRKADMQKVLAEM